MRYLGNPLRRLRSSDVSTASAIAVIDTQPGIGNSAVAATTTVKVVIDHHPLADVITSAEFVDVRPELGATATIMTQYLQDAALHPSPQLATALFYGIKTDTMGLVRGATPADIAAYLYLQPLIDPHQLIGIEQAQVSAAYFDHLSTAVHAARVYDRMIMAYIGTMSYPDLVGEMADMLLRLEGMQWSICMGAYDDTLILSVRTRNRRTDAGALIRAVVGRDGTAGGHGMLAGGQISLTGRDANHVVQMLWQRALHYLNVPSDYEGTPLIPATAEELAMTLPH